jgi:hypothetical protein
VRSTAWLDRLRSFQGPSGAEVVQLDVALLECPVGDRYINQELWTLIDEQVIALERKAILEDNGFRVGQVGGIPPAGLQALLASERNCPKPRRLQTHANTPTPVVLGPAVPSCRLEVHQDGKLVPVELKDAQCTLQVVPSLLEEGRTRLHFTPQIQHGAARLFPQPAEDRSGLVLKDQRPTEEYPAVGWDVTLAPGQYVVVGTRFDRPGTLGYQCFFRGDEPRPVQRLLVICAGRSAAGLEPETDPDSGNEDPSFSRSPPLALQASCTTARGSGP